MSKEKLMLFEPNSWPALTWEFFIPNAFIRSDLQPEGTEMRIIVHTYASGNQYAYTTDNDGRLLEELMGRREPGARIMAAVELVCDDNEDGRSALFRALGDASRWVKQTA